MYVLHIPDEISYEHYGEIRNTKEENMGKIMVKKLAKISIKV